MHEIGNSIWMLPTVAVADFFATQLYVVRPDRQDRLPLFLITFHAAMYVAGSCAACYYLANRCFGVAKKYSLLAALIMGVSSQMLAYSDFLFDGLSAGLLLLLAVCFAARAVSSHHERLVLLSGLAIGMSLVTRLTAILAIPALALYLMEGPGGRRRLVLFGLSLAPFALWQGWYNFVRTGSPLVSAEMLPAANNGRGSTVAGLEGLLFSPSKSIFIYTPVLLLTVFGVSTAWARNRRLTLLLIWLVGGYVCSVASLSHWHGDWAWGPRYFVAVEPLMFIFLATFLDRFHGPPAKWITTFLAFLGTLVNLPAKLGNWHFRMTLWYAQHGSEFPYWDLRHTQWLDAWQGVGHNLAYMRGQTQLLRGTSRSEANILAANTINIWWLSARHFGFPGWAGLGTALLLLSLAALSLVRLWRIVATAESDIVGHEGAN
jgi:hypothetical protein